MSVFFSNEKENKVTKSVELLPSNVEDNTEERLK